ncbi:tyrosine-type recombinase/integrase [Paraburkholderia sp. A1RO-5L]|uniref:tyrosine-type recombinase/integrase n=1 Tax=Paraburkholderia sp. A1RO-5L TaxID=3028370 RepID=UPI003B7CFDF0
MKNFDPRTAAKLTAGQHILIDGSPGLRLVASASRKTWQYRYRTEAGRLGQVSIGQWPKVSVAAAIAEWEKLRAERDAGRDPGAERRTARAMSPLDSPDPAAPASVADVLRDYVNGHINVNRKEKGATEVRRMFDKMLTDKFKAMPAVAVTRRTAFDVISAHSAIPVQASNLRRELGAAWDHALDGGRLPDGTGNWWRQIMRGKLQSKGKTVAGEKTGVVKRALSPSETGRLIVWLPNYSRTVEDALTLYLWTCLRGAEICAIEGHEVSEEPDGWWLTIPKAKTKNARRPNATDMRVPLVGRALAIILRRREVHGDGFLFPSEVAGRSIEQKVVQTATWFHMPYSQTRPNWERPRCPVTAWAPHDLRRTSRTLLSALGVRAEVAEACLGHMKPGIVGVYDQHQFEPEKRAALVLLSTELERLAAEAFQQKGTLAPTS